MDVEESMYQKIREKPGLYIRKPSLALLAAFMNGYMIREYEIYGGDQTNEEYWRFQKFVQDYYGITNIHPDIPITEGSNTIICENCSNEEEAFYKFFEIRDQFKRNSSKSQNEQLQGDAQNYKIESTTTISIE